MVSMRALECLVTTVEQGSLTKAAAVLHMSQPALSHQIAAVERELVAVVAAPHDDLLRRFVRDLKRRGLPDSRMPLVQRRV